jgi:predicted RNA-binding protein with PIN domain
MKRTTLVVDGYNAINAIPETKKKMQSNLLSARNAIVAITKEYVRSSGYITDFYVVFDGLDKYRRQDRLSMSGRLRQVFSRTGKGDEKIIGTVRKSSGSGKVIVASNDNFVRNMSRGYGAAIMDVRELAGKKKRKGKRVERSSEKRISGDVKAKITREYGEELGIG